MLGGLNGRPYIEARAAGVAPRDRGRAMRLSTSSDPDSGLVAITLADEQGHMVRSRVVSAEVAERVGYLFLGMAAAARAKGERTAFVNLDEVVLAAESD